MAKELKTLTVGELRVQLERLPADMPIVFAVPSGDHWRTLLAGEIGAANRERVVWSEYHRAFRLRTLKEEEEGEHADAQEVILLD